MKPIKLLLLLTLPALFGSAQTVAEFDDLIMSTHSNVIPASDLTYSQYVHHNGATYVLFRTKKDPAYVFFKIADDMSIERLGEYKLESEDSRISLAKVGSRIYTPFFITDREQKLNCMFIQEFDIEEGKHIGDPIRVDCLQGDDFYHDFANSFATYKTTRDHSKLLIYYKLPEMEDGTRVFRFAVFNASLDLLWTQDVPAKDGDRKLLVGNQSWGSANGFFGSSSGADAIKMDEKGDIYFWSATEIRHRGEMPQIFVTRVSADGYEHQNITQTDCDIVLNAISPTDVQLVAKNDGVFISGHVDRKAGDKDTRWANRGKLFGKWDSEGLAVFTYPYSYDILLESHDKKARERYASLEAKHRPVGWMEWPPKSYNTDHALKADDKGMYFVERGPTYYLLYFVTNEGEMRWIAPLAMHDMPEVVDGGDRALLIFHDHVNNLKKGWSHDNGITYPSSETSVGAIGYVLDSDPTEKVKRKMTSAERGGAKYYPSLATEIRPGKFVYIDVDRTEPDWGTPAKYAYKVGLIQILE